MWITVTSHLYNMDILFKIEIRLYYQHYYHYHYYHHPRVRLL